MPSEFELAINQICEEKGLKKEEIIETINAAMAAAYKKDYDARGQNIKTEFDPITGQCRVYDLKDVVKKEEDKEKPKRQLTLAEAKKIKKGVKVEDVITTEVTPKEEMHFGRIAAQTAKQVILQRIREAEKNMIVTTFRAKVGKVINVVVQRLERQVVFVDLGVTAGVLLPQEQIFREHYHRGQRLKVYIKEVRETIKGPEVLVSRTHPEIVKELFVQEVPEIANGTVEIKAVARESGSRSKIAVSTKSEKVDPIGACVGQRGIRVQTVIAELGGEKIDIIQWFEDPVKFITHALAPAKVISVKLNEKDKKAEVTVREDQLSLAIGREGQNVRLAVRLTGWNIDIIKEGKEAPKKGEAGVLAKIGEKEKETKKEAKVGVPAKAGKEKASKKVEKKEAKKEKGAEKKETKKEKGEEAKKEVRKEGKGAVKKMKKVEKKKTEEK